MNDGDWTRVLANRLFEQRVVLLSGPLDDATATRASAELMTLDAEGDEAVSLRIDSAEGSLGLALTLMDVIELMGVPVRALCLGQVGGPAIGVLSVCSHRAAMPSTRFSWREPTTQYEARAREAEQWAQLRSDERQRFTERIAAAIGKPAALVADTLAGGMYMTVQEASDFGLIDEICRPKGEIRSMPGPPIGFRPRH
jgi:ATP-dependent Clp protease, protease subunit